MQTQGNAYQNTNGILNRTRTNNPKMYMEPQKTQKVKVILRKQKKKKKCWRYHTLWFQSILQSYSNQNSMVLAQKHT